MPHVLVGQAAIVGNDLGDVSQVAHRAEFVHAGAQVSHRYIGWRLEHLRTENRPRQRPTGRSRVLKIPNRWWSDGRVALVVVADLKARFLKRPGGSPLALGRYVIER